VTGGEIWRGGAPIWWKRGVSSHRHRCPPPRHHYIPSCLVSTGCKFGDLDAHVSKRAFEGPLGERGDALKPFVRHRAPLASEGGLARLSVSRY
jgi:hypothetical protein